MKIIASAFALVAALAFVPSTFANPPVRLAVVQPTVVSAAPCSFVGGQFIQQTAFVQQPMFVQSSFVQPSFAFAASPFALGVSAPFVNVGIGGFGSPFIGGAGFGRTGFIGGGVGFAGARVGVVGRGARVGFVGGRFVRR